MTSSDDEEEPCTSTAVINRSKRKTSSIANSHETASSTFSIPNSQQTPRCNSQRIEFDNELNLLMENSSNNKFDNSEFT